MPRSRRLRRAEISSLTTLPTPLRTGGADRSIRLYSNVGQAWLKLGANSPAPQTLQALAERFSTLLHLQFTPTRWQSLHFLVTYYGDRSGSGVVVTLETDEMWRALLNMFLADETRPEMTVRIYQYSSSATIPVEVVTYRKRRLSHRQRMLKSMSKRARILCAKADDHVHSIMGLRDPLLVAAAEGDVEDITALFELHDVLAGEANKEQRDVTEFLGDETRESGEEDRLSSGWIRTYFPRLDVNVDTWGVTPIELAAHRANLEMVRHLLAQGAVIPGRLLPFMRKYVPLLLDAEMRTRYQAVVQHLEMQARENPRYRARPFSGGAQRSVRRRVRRRHSSRL